jgi:hypothetical protein
MRKNMTILRVTENGWSVYFNPARNWGNYENVENGLTSSLIFTGRRLENFVPMEVIKILRGMKLVVPRNFEKRRKRK